MLYDQFSNAAKRFPKKIAIVCDNQKISYEELENLVLFYSHTLLNIGIAHKDHIIIPMSNSIESIALMLTSLKLGFAIIPTNPSVSIQSLNKACKRCNAKHIIAKKIFYENLGEAFNIDLAGQKICLDSEYKTYPSLVEGKINTATYVPLVQTVDENNSFIIALTSGSTGNPKPINLTQKTKRLRIERHVEMYHLTHEDTILAATPLYHTLAERLTLLPLMIGATSILLPRFTPKKWIDCVLSEKVTFTIAVSAQLNSISKIIEQEKIELKSLRCLVSSSALLAEETKMKLLKYLNCEFHEIYGTSETSTITDIHFDANSNKKNSVGKPLKGAKLKIVDDFGVNVPTNTTGEILCHTDLICQGYYNQPTVFKENLLGDYFMTGDLGYVDEDGYLYYQSRKKEIIITGGINVYPKDIEDCVLQLEEISECAAFSVPDENLGEIVGLAIVATSPMSERAIAVHCAKFLADYQQPRKIFFLDALPKNSLNKLERFKLADLVDSLN